MQKTKKERLTEQMERELEKVVKTKSIFDDEANKALEELMAENHEKLRMANNALEKARHELGKTKHQLEEMDNDCRLLKRLYEQQELAMKRQLSKWLATDSQIKVENTLKHYHREERLALMNAMMIYLMTGKRTNFTKEIMNWHFRLFCDMIDEDRYTVPSHTLLKRLWEKIGLLRKFDNG